MFETSEFILWSFTENKISESERKKKNKTRKYISLDKLTSRALWSRGLHEWVARSHHHFIVPSSLWHHLHSLHIKICLHIKKKKNHLHSPAFLHHPDLNHFCVLFNSFLLIRRHSASHSTSIWIVFVLCSQLLNWARQESNQIRR